MVDRIVGLGFNRPGVTADDSQDIIGNADAIILEIGELEAVSVLEAGHLDRFLNYY